jgi:hypothetical protein
MAARPRQIFFSYLAHMLYEQASNPSNFLPALLYLHLLCVPRHYWHSTDRLRFPHWMAYGDALLEANRLLPSEPRLPPYQFLLQRLRDLLLYLDSRPATPTQSRCGRHRVRISALEVMRLLDDPAFRAFLTAQANHKRRHNPALQAMRWVYQEEGLTCLELTAPELFPRCLTLLAQQGWLEVSSAAPAQEVSIRFLRVPSLSAALCT